LFQTFQQDCYAGATIPCAVGLVKKVAGTLFDTVGVVELSELLRNV